jgi:hypothetical protein
MSWDPQRPERCVAAPTHHGWALHRHALGGVPRVAATKGVHHPRLDQ